MNTSNAEDNLEKDLSEAEAETVAREGALADRLRAGLRPDERHYALTQLRGLAADRKQLGAQWPMPEHLAVCPLCLEAFEIVREGLPEIGPKVRERYIEIFEASGATIQHQAFPRWYRRALRVAAALLVVGASAFALFHSWRVASQYLPQSSGVVREGMLVAAGSETVPVGAVLPANQPIHAVETARVTLDDGSALIVSQNAEFSLSGSRRRGVTVDLAKGQVTAEVVPQEGGRQFVVKTALGEFRVVGTRFSVTASSENVVVFENQGGVNGASRSYADLISTVILKVEEGSILVKNRHEQAVVGAGQTAILRAGQERIEVR